MANTFDNDPDDLAPFIQLAALTANVVRFLQSNKTSVDTPSGSLVSGCRSLRSGKSPEMLTAEHRAPSLTIPPQGNSLESAPIVPVLGPIGLVFGAGSLTQIAKSVVEPIAVDVVNDSDRPSSVNVEPSQVVQLVLFPEEEDRTIPTRTMAGELTRADIEPIAALASDAPRPSKLASERIVSQQIPQFVGCNHGSHRDKKEHKHAGADRARCDHDEQRQEQSRQYVEHRLNELRSFERRAAGYERKQRYFVRDQPRHKK